MNRSVSDIGCGADTAGVRHETSWPWRDIPDPGPVPPAAPVRASTPTVRCGGDARDLEDIPVGGLRRGAAAVGMTLLVGALLYFHGASVWVCGGVALAVLLVASVAAGWVFE